MNGILKGVLCTGAAIGIAAYLSPLIFQANYFNFCVINTSGINDKEPGVNLNLNSRQSSPLRLYKYATAAHKNIESLINI